MLLASTDGSVIYHDHSGAAQRGGRVDHSPIGRRLRHDPSPGLGGDLRRGCDFDDALLLRLKL